MPVAPMEDEIMTTQEAAEFLRVNPKTITRWLKAGKIRGLRLGGGGGKVLYLKSNLLAALEFWTPINKENLHPEQEKEKEAESGIAITGEIENI